MNEQTTAVQELVELVQNFFKDKLLFVAKTTADTFSVIKVVNDGTKVKINDGDTLCINESY